MTLVLLKVEIMVSLQRSKISSFINFYNIFSKTLSNVKKNHQALFHCSFLLNGPGQEIKMPSLSPTMTEGKIVKWLKKEGDALSPGDVLCDIETDKAVVSMEVEEDGVLAKILVHEGSSLIKVGSLIALMVAEGEDWKKVDIPSEVKATSFGSLSTSSSSSSISSSSSSSSSPSSSSSSSSSEFDPDDAAELVISGPPTISVKMPSLSPTMTAGTILKWLKKEGDLIAPGDVLCDIQTDKAVMSMETEEEGILAKILVPNDSKDVKVGTLIALIVGENEDWKSVKVTSSAPQPTTNVVAGESDMPSKVFGPAVKALLATYQIEPGLIKGSGKSNRLLKEDVLKYIEDNKLQKKLLKSVSSPAIDSKSTSPPPKVGSKSTKVPPQLISKYKDIEITNARQIIAKQLVQSKRDIPHSYFVTKCEVGQLLEVKDVLLAEGYKISLNDLLAKATALALQIYPKANTVFINDEVKISTNVDINVVVDIDSELYTTTIKKANLKDLGTISQEIKDSAVKAKNGLLNVEESQGGSIMISNLGSFGVKQYTAIINPPQCAALGVGSISESLDIDLKTRKHMLLNFTYDSRALGENEAAEYMETLKYIIENPKIIMSGVNCKKSEIGL